MPRDRTIDQIDRRMLDELATDGRVTVTELARRVGLSKSPCQARMRRLEEAGIIRGYRAMLDAVSLGAAHIAFVQVKLDDTTAPALAATWNLELIREAKERVEIPIIASLNGVTDEGWIQYAKQMEEAGADGLEVNVFYIPADINLSGQEVEQRYLDIVHRVKSTISIPVAVKLNPYFSAMGNMAKQLVGAGADGLVLFNRFYQPDIDVSQLKVVPNLRYSEAVEIRLPLLWVAALHGRVNASLAATTGVQGSREVMKYLLAGADVVMTASALYKYGIEYISTMLAELETWMKEMEFYSLNDFRGLLSQKEVEDPTAFERANYIKVLGSKR